MAKNFDNSELKQASEAITPDAKRPQAVQVFSELLNYERAPKGNIETNFKTALYVCAATKHGSFEEMVSQNKLIMLGFMLSSVGFSGPTQDLTIQDYLDTLQELIDEGALEYIGEGSGFVSAGFKRESEGEVSCATSHNGPANLTTSELRFTDDLGSYPLFSKFVIIPGDKVRVVINTFLNTAYVQSIVTMRKMVIGEASENNKIFFREKGIAAYNTTTTKDGVPFSIGDLVVTEIVARKSPNVLVIRPREVVHGTGSLNTFICKAVLEHGLPNTWPDVVKRSIKKVPTIVDKSEIAGRVDLRDLPLVTIDSEDARDFDDAVYCKKEGDKYRLYVAIADVSYYVRTGSAIDTEALERTTSVYFPFYVIPMLPKELSNGICSLNPNVDRLCMVCEMVIDKKGKIEDYEFYPAVMNSHARLTYTEAHLMITEDSVIEEEHTKCIPWIKDLHELYQALKSARDARGVFEFESTEVHFLFNERWKVKGIEPDYRNEAHMLIEECMIAANICAASFVRKNGFQTLYRIHERPNPEKLDKLRAILSRYGIDLRHQYEPTPLDFKDVSEQVMKLGEGIHQVISLQLLRAMSKAKYSPENVGHFGLALENYAHFTSPIRRYPDLQIHRVIKYILEKQKKRDWGKIGAQQYSREALVQLGYRCSEKELDADGAEYDVDNSLKCEYVKNFIGEAVDGTVSTVSTNGIYITLNDFFVDGMISSRSVFSINANNQSFAIDNSHTFKVGDQIKVRVAEVNSLARFITLVPVVNMRKTDVLFDMADKKEKLKANTTAKPEINNDSKDELFARLADISRGVDASENDGVVREHISYSIANNLDLSKSVAAIMNDDDKLLEAAADAAKNAAEEEKQARKVKAKPKASDEAKSKAKATTKSTTKSATTKVAAGAAEAPKAKSATKIAATKVATEPKLAAKTATKDVSKPKTAAKAETKVATEPKATASTKAKPAAPGPIDDGAPVITVKRKSKSAQETKIIELDTKASKAKEEPVDQLLVDTASRIDADISDAKVAKKTTKTSSIKDNDSAKPTKATASKSRSNAKAKQEVPESVEEHQIDGDTKVTVKVRTRASAKSTDKELKAMVKAVKAEKQETVSKESAAKATAKVSAAKAKSTEAKAPAAKSNAAKTKTTKDKAPADKTTKAKEAEKAPAAKSTATKAKASTAKATAAKTTKAKEAEKAPAAKSTATKAKGSTAKATAAKPTKAKEAEKAPAAKNTATKAKGSTAKATAAKTTKAKEAQTKAPAAKSTATKAKASKAKASAAKSTKAKEAAVKAPAAKSTTTKAKASTAKASAAKTTKAKEAAVKAPAAKSAATKAKTSTAKATAAKTTKAKEAEKAPAAKSTTTKAKASAAKSAATKAKASATKATAAKSKK